MDKSTKEKGFPIQKISLSKKTDKWKEACVDSIIATENTTSFAGERKKTMDVAYGLYNSEYDEDDLKYVTNPFKVEDGFPAKTKNINRIKPKIDLLIGEESKRPFNMRVIQTNDDAVGKLQDKKKEMLLKYVQQQIAGDEPQVDNDGKPVTPAEIEKYMKYSYKSIAEETAYHSLNYLRKKLNLTNEFLKGWKDGLISGEEIYYVGSNNGEPTLERVNPMECDYDKNPDLEFIEDGDKFVRRMRMSPESIYDRYFDMIDESDLDKLLKISEKSGKINTGSKVNTKSIIYKERMSSDFMSQDEDSNNLLDLYHAVWRSFNEIGFVEQKTKDGDVKLVPVDKTYKPEEGEEIDWQWVDEIWEGYRVGSEGGENIYFGMGPVDYQTVSVENLTGRKLPYCGVRYNDSNTNSKSLVTVMKDLQYMYIILWYRAELTIARDKGKVLTMDITQIPKGLTGMDVNQWMHYVSALGVNFVNPYDEGWDVPGREGGKPSSYNQMTSMDLSTGNILAEYVNLMGKIEDMIGEISGVSKAREGQISERSLVGNVQREVIQSSHITEPLFWVHNQCKRNSLTSLLNAAKNIWGEQDNKKLHYILSDTGRIFMDITEDFLYSDMDVFLTDTTKEIQDIEEVKGLLQHALQSGASLLDAAEIISGDNMSQIKHKLTETEMKRAQMQEQAAKVEQAKVQLEQDKLRIEEEDSIRKTNTDIEVALIRAEASEGDIDEDDIDKEKLDLQRQKQEDEREIKEKKLREEIREARKAEQQKQQEIEIKRKMANKSVSGGTSTKK